MDLNDPEYREDCFTVDVLIFNRWGDKIFEAKNYQNDWAGEVQSNSLGSAKRVPTGTYFYIITVKELGVITNKKTGFFYLTTK